ncbi:MAG: A24 family peptidase [Caldilineales bacterium]|nr:A24 family peptidase [Caldilineales bacterium]
MLTVFVLIALGLLGGYLVNRAADVLPRGHPAVLVASASPTTAAAVRTGFGAWRPGLVYGMATLLACLAVVAWGQTPAALVVMGYSWFLLAVAVIDLEHRLVLNRMLAPGAVGALILSLATGLPPWSSALAAALVGFGLFWLLRLPYPQGMGMGDVKLAGFIGLITGWPGVLVALVIGILAGGLAALGVVLVKSQWRPWRFPRGHSFAYAPYLVFGAWVVLFAFPHLVGSLSLWLR